ncbi:MAG: class I SAM-dependent methyltransferase [Deltaproteobacteria bacterium]|nr:class I SAM-dependent methyltransferase [Deltaproteobacteria bacterium]
MRGIVIRLIDMVLSAPAVFEWQQRLCNDYSAVREEFKTHLDSSGKDILDIGCSTGACAGKVVSMDKNRYVGIDTRADYIKTASERYPRGAFLHMDARRLDFMDNRFDVVILSGTLHHMDDGLTRECLKEARRVLKNDGAVLVAEPVFTKGSFLSNLLLGLDRGRFIRSLEGYRGLFNGFSIIRENFFRFSLHRFCSFVLVKASISSPPQPVAGALRRLAANKIEKGNAGCVVSSQGARGL